MSVQARLAWAVIITQAAVIARSYSTQVTLRQLHYRLVAANIGGYENTLGCYKRLSELTAEARRRGSFPPLSDRTRGVHRLRSFGSRKEAVTWAASVYRRNRTEGQDHQVWVLYEKATLGAQVESWLTDYGIPSAALRGYSSESLEREIFTAMERDGRPIVVHYIGDLDPEGEDIERNFKSQAIRWSLGESDDDDDEEIDVADLLTHDGELDFVHWEKLTVEPHQITPFGLVPNPGKATSSRAAGFIRKYGALFQIEVEAVDPRTLQNLVIDAVTDDAFFDQVVWEALLVTEEEEREALKKSAKRMR